MLEPVPVRVKELVLVWVLEPVLVSMLVGVWLLVCVEEAVPVCADDGECV